VRLPQAAGRPHDLEQRRALLLKVHGHLHELLREVHACRLLKLFELRQLPFHAALLAALLHQCFRELESQLVDRLVVPDAMQVLRFHDSSFDRPQCRSRQVVGRHPLGRALLVE